MNILYRWQSAIFIKWSSNTNIFMYTTYIYCVFTGYMPQSAVSALPVKSQTTHHENSSRLSHLTWFQLNSFSVETE